MKTLVTVFWLSLLLFARNGWADLAITVQIDGNSRLVIQRDQIYWTRVSSDRPISPTSLNGVPWTPQWPSNSAMASLPLKVTAVFPGGVAVNPSGRGSVSVFQQPSAANNFTLILDFNDLAFAGADYYFVNVQGVFLSVGGSPQETLLVPRGSVWRYLDNGSDPGFEWQNLFFDDSSWASGRAQLGYGDGDEATLVSYGPNANFKYVTTYFRRAFAVENPRSFLNLTVRLLRDDGGIVYLNGIEIFRSNMPFGFIDSQTLASSTIPNADESVFFATNVDPALLSETNVIAVEIHQASRNSSDISFDFELSGSSPTGPPILLQHPRSQTVAPGGTATFSVQAAGPAPLRYQWYFDGVPVQGETNAALIATDVMPGDEGTVSVVVDNPFGSVPSASAGLSVVELTGDLFQITALSTNHVGAIESSGVTGDDRGGIAATFNDLYVTGDAGTARFALGDLSGATSTGQFHDSLVSDLKSGKIYVLATGDTPSTIGIIDSLIELDPSRGVLTTNAIRLSAPVDMHGCYGCMGVFSGFGRIALHNNSRAFVIGVPSGIVQDLGGMAAPPHLYSENWAYWGVAEFFENATWLVYVRDFQTISRTRVPDGFTAMVGKFDNLSEMGSITVSPVLNRWYFNHQYNSQFRVGYETVGFADASLAHALQSQPPAILIPPHDQVVREGSNATFTVTALGYPLRYQWRFQEQAIAGATNPSLALTGVSAAKVGLYSVLVSNSLGSVLSQPALLNVVNGQTHRSAVAVLGAESTLAWNQDVAQKIRDTGLFVQVDEFLVTPGYPVPSLEQLQQYDAILAYSDNVFNDPVALGNVLADYVDGGRGVVLATFAFGGQLAGRLAQDGYLPFNNNVNNNSFPGLTLIADDPVHPILNGVGSLNGGGSSYHNSPLLLASGATQVAHWSNGQPLIGVKTRVGASVVGLNFFPPSSSVRGDFWDANTDGGLLMANALIFAGGKGGDTVPSVPPGIRTQPVGVTVLQGLDAKMTVSAYGSPQLAHQWLLNDAPVANATNASLLISDVQTNQAGAYRVVVTNAYGAVTSIVATLTVQPTRGVAGYFTDFNISATGLVQVISSARFTPRRIENISTFDLSRLSLLLINETSDHPSPELRIRQPAIQDWVNRGGRLVVHQSYLNSEARTANPLLPGVRDTVFTNYNDFGADINLIPPGNTLVTAGPHGVLNNTSLDGEFFAGTTAVGSTLPAGGAAILGGGPNTNFVVAFAYGLGAGLVYFAVLPLDYYLEFGSSPAALNLRNIYAPNVVEYVAGYVPAGPPRIFGGPNDAVITAGADATFFVSARGQAPLRFQWLYNGNPLAGATNNPLRITNVVNANAGTYAVIVSNDLNSARSRDATLKIVPRLEVGIFNDPDFVITQPGSPANVADNLKASLNQLGHIPRPLTNLTSAVTNNILLFPELVNNSLSPFLDESTRGLLQAHVLQGGLLISAGAYYSNIEFLNSVFGFSLYTPGSITGAEFSRSSEALGTPFTNGPSSVFGNFNTYPVYKFSLPPGTRSLYENTDFEAAAVAWIPYGAGAILVLGWNWNDAIPLGTQDNGWLEALANALQSRGISTPTPLIQVPLVSVGALWRYLDNGSDQGTAWQGVTFDDSSWAVGPAPLGYGNGSEATQVSYGPDATHKHATTYFRRTFTLANAGVTTNLVLRLLRDDGAAVYLNGVEIVRECLATGAGFNTYAFCDVAGSEEDQFFTYYVDSGNLRPTNVLAVEIHQVSPANPDINFNLELTGFAPAPAPVVRTQPVGKTVPVGSTAMLDVVAAGALPMSYQWRLEGQILPGATNAILILNNIAIPQSGNYSVLISNALGMVVSSNAMVRAVTLASDTFQITSLSSNNAFITDHYELTRDGGGSLAASDQQVFFSGYADSARFSLTDLSGGTNLNQIVHAWVSDLKTEKVYLLSGDDEPLTYEGGIVKILLELEGSTGQFSGRSIRLSQGIPLKNPINRGGEVGIFAGFGRIVLHDGKHTWTIELPSGQVVELGEMAIPFHAYSQTWAYWGVAEYFNGALWLTYVRDSFAIVRTRVPDGRTQVVAAFEDLGSTPSITISLPLNRWYFHQDSQSQFGPFYQTIGCADAEFVSSAPPIPPVIVKAPTNQTIAATANTSFRVVARGTGPLRYQWLFNGTALPGATNATLDLVPVRTNDSGAYSVLVSNTLDHALSPAAILTVVPLTGETFHIARLSDQAVVVNDYVVAGYDRSAIAVSAQRAFYTGNSGTALFHLSDLSHGTNPGVYIDGLVSDLRTETVYALANGTDLVSSGIVTALREVDGLTGSLTDRSVTLSEPIDLGFRYGEIGLFAGVGRIVLTDGMHVWNVDTSNGHVLSLGSMAFPQHTYTENGLYWGVAEFFDNSLWLVYVRDYMSIVRTRIPDGSTEVLAGFSNLSDMAAITVSIPYNRWIFHHQYAAQFGGYLGTLGFADADFLTSLPPIPPVIVNPPLDQSIGAGGTVQFNVVARGTGPLHYQWQFESVPVPGATNSVLLLTNIPPGAAGRYSVVVQNAAGQATSAPARLRVVPSVTVAMFNDPGFVDNNQPAHLRASLNRLGHQSSLFSNITQAASGNVPLLFPAMEVGDLASGMTASNRSALQSFVGRGGTLIMVGTASDYSRPARVLNTVFGYALQPWGAFAFASRTPQAAGTRFQDDPESIPANDFTFGFDLNFLPPGSRTIYSEPGGPATVLWVPYGSGRIVFLGWTWNDAVPLGHQDGGWLTVLESAIEETIAPVGQAPELLLQPESKVVVVGSPARFSAAGTGSPFTYQWLFKGQPLPGATNYILQLDNVTTNAAGLYSVRLGNAFGSATSSNALLTVVQPVTVGVFDDPRFVNSQGGTFSDSHNLQVSLTQLGHRVQPITNLTTSVTNQVLIFPPLDQGDLVSTLDEPTRTALRTFVQQGGLVICNGYYNNVDFINAVFGFSLGVYGNGNGPFPRTSQAQGTAFANGPSSLPYNYSTLDLTFESLPPLSSLNLYGSQSPDLFSAVALLQLGNGNIIYLGWNWQDAVPAGSQDSGWVETLGNAVLTRVLPSARPPVIRIQPLDNNVLAGRDVRLNVSGYGSPSPQVQWFHNGQPISGATNVLLTLPSVAAAQAGSYQVILSNPSGSATSRVATLIVRPSRGLAGYVQTCCGYSLQPLVDSVESAGFTAVEIQDISTFDLSRLSLLLLVVDSSGRSHPIFKRLTHIAAWVNNGGRLIVHDWYPSTEFDPHPFLFAAPGTALVPSFEENIQILSTGNNPVAAGPFGNLNNSSLDNLGASAFGYAVRGTLPPRALPILGAGFDTNAVVAFWYGLGAGSIYYAGMPLDYHLNRFGTQGDAIRNVYLPNVVELAATYAVVGPPVLLDQPHPIVALEGGTATLAVGVNGQLPLTFQWFFDGARIPAATNVALVLPILSSANAGSYQVTVANSFGTITSATAVVSVIQAAPFRITALTSNSSQIVDHDFITGDDRGGIAVSATHVYYTGDSTTGRFSATNLLDGAALSWRYDALVSDLRSETVYTLVNDSNLVDGSSTQVTGLIALQGNTGDLTTNFVSLSKSIPIGLETGLFSSYGAVILHSQERAYRIDLPSGLVLDLGPMESFPHASCENWAYWGVAEYFAGALYLDYVLDTQTIARRRIPDGFTTNLASFGYLSDMCSFSVSVLRSRWYFHHEGASQFGSGSEVLGYATATFDRPPRFNPAAITNQIIYEDTATEPISFGILDNETPVNQLVMIGKSSNPLLLPETNILFTGTNITRTVTLTPVRDQFGTSTVTLVVFDSSGLSTNRSFTLTVLPLNDPPAFTKGIDVTVLEDSGAFVRSNWATAISPGPANELDQVLTFLATNDNPTLFAAPPAISAAGTLSFTPAANAVGTALVTVRLQDNGGTSGGGLDTSPPRTFTVTITPVNDPPSFAKGPDVTVPEDAGPQIIPGWATQIRRGPIDESGQTVSFLLSVTNSVLFSAPPSITPDGTLRFTSAPNANGNAMISVRLQDNGGTLNGGADSSLPQTFAIQVLPVNDRPQANGQTVSTAEDTPITITLTGSDIDGDALTFNISAPPAHGTVTGTGVTRTYRPATNFFGDDSFTFRANDGQLDSPDATVTIHISPVNDLPATISQSLTNNEDTPLTITLTGSDADGDSLTFSIVASPAHGVLTGAGANRSYQPAADYNGADSFTFKANDGHADSVPTTISIMVLPVNDPPAFSRGPNQSVAWDSGLQTIIRWATNISAGPTNEAGQSLTFEIVGDAPSLFATAPAISPDGTLTYSPASNAIGVATLTVRLHDNGGVARGGQDTSAAQTFLITVRQANQPPVASIRVSPLITLTPDSTNGMVLSANNSNAVVVLDGSFSTDPENDVLGFAWFENSNLSPFAVSMVTSNVFNLGAHSIRLVVNDGRNSGAATSIVQVVSASDALCEIIAFIGHSGLAQNRQRPLLATLEAAAASFARSSFNSGINQLRAFQNKLRAQLASEDPALSDILMGASQKLIDAERPSPRLHVKLGSPNPRLELSLTGEVGETYVIQTSADLVHWSTLTNIVSITGTNQFIDGTGTSNGRRFYRAVSP